MASSTYTQGSDDATRDFNSSRLRRDFTDTTAAYQQGYEAEYARATDEAVQAQQAERAGR